MPCLSDVKLVLFFSRGASLKVWDDVGMLEREVEIYRRLRAHLGGISFLTYGGAGEFEYTSKLDGIQVLCNRWRLQRHAFGFLAALLYRSQMQGADVFKTNQIRGAEAAVFAKRLFAKRMIVRCGYMWSLNAARQAGTGSAQARLARRTEALAFQAADRVVVTTEQMKRYVVDHYSISADSICVIPNYVITDLFKPEPKTRLQRTLCFIGRLSEEKNLAQLLEAARGLDIKLLIIGQGPLRASLETRARQLSVDVSFLERVPHVKLPQYLNQASVYILPSLYEGHPKTLLEAMACGLPVIGTDVPGISELIEHRQTGFLCGTSAAEIRAAIREVMDDDELRDRMGREAQEFVVENFSIEKALELELELLQSLLENGE